jgi:hypothetical protein
LNTAYQDFVNFVCHKKRGKPGQKAETFFDYKNRICTTNASQPYCQGHDYTALVKKYLEDYSDASMNGNNVVDANKTQAISLALGKSPINYLSQQDAQSFATSSRLRDALSNFVGDGNVTGPTFTNTSSGTFSPTVTSSASARVSSPRIEKETGNFVAPNQVPETGTLASGAFSSSLSSASTTTSETTAQSNALTEAKSRVNEIDTEKELLRSQLQEANEKLAQANENERKIQEERIKYLEQKDSQLSNELSGLKKTISDLEKVKAANESQRANERIAEDKIQNSRSSGNSFQLNNQVPEISQNTNQANDNSRNPASLSSAAGSTSASVAAAQMNGSSSKSNGFASSSNSALNSTSFNQVLLAKYGIKVNGSTEPSLIVNQEQDATKLQKLSSQSSSSEIPLNVSADVYSGFENRNQTIIKKYEKLINDSSVPVVKLMVQTEGKEPLEIYMVKEQGKIVMQPVRRVTREALVQTLTE